MASRQALRSFITHPFDGPAASVAHAFLKQVANNADPPDGHNAEISVTYPAVPSLKEIERRHIKLVLATSRTLREAAMRLGIDQSTLWRKRKRYEID